MEPIVVAHGGVGTRNEHSDGPIKAAKVAMDRLTGVVEPLTVEFIEFQRPTARVVDAVVEGTVVMEDDPRFDCGTGSYLRLDGSIEMDAAVMDSKGEFGGVLGIYDVQNPIRVARLVMETPHNLICGRGAVDFARQFGFQAADCTTDKCEERLQKVKATLRGEREVKPWAKPFADFAHRSCYIDMFLKTDGSEAKDTVGVVARDEDGNYATAGSTGGTSYQLPGRVGDTAVPGAGLFAGKDGAVSATGIGEVILERVLAKAVYDLIASGESVQKACEWGVDQYDPDIPVGIIAVGDSGYGIAANDVMAAGKALLD